MVPHILNLNLNPTPSPPTPLDGSHPHVGIQAMLAAMTRNGNLPNKKKIAGGTDEDKQQMVSDLLKLGKHLLK